MRKLRYILLAATIPALLPLDAQAWDLKDVLGNLGSAKSDSSSANTESCGKSKGSLGSLVAGFFSRDDIKLVDIAGSWKYVDPAISFQSENLLLKAGGVAATEKLKRKVEPYYKAAGLDKLEIKIEHDSTFTMTFKRGTLKGAITTDVPEGSDANFIFRFKALGSIGMGKMETYVTRSGENINLMFDITKLVQLIQKMSSISGNTTAKEVSSLLDKYDGVHAGFELSPLSLENRK